MAAEQRLQPQTNDQVQAEIKKRLLENGEWDRCVHYTRGSPVRSGPLMCSIQTALQDHLRESGWMDDVKDLAKGAGSQRLIECSADAAELARKQDDLNIEGLHAEVAPKAKRGLRPPPHKIGSS